VGSRSAGATLAVLRVGRCRPVRAQASTSAPWKSDPAAWA